MPNQVVIIDDDAEDIEIIAETIESLGTECVAFTDACDALEYLRSVECIPRLIIIDINMPKLSGEQCLEQIQVIEKLKRVPIAVYSSARATEELMKHFESAGAIFFRKPTSYKELYSMISNLLSRVTEDRT